MVAPWTNFWNINVFFEAYPSVQDLLASPFIRGAVSGVGGITTLAGLAELVTAIFVRHRDSPPATDPEL